MKTTRAWGWLAAGVLALGLNGIYHDGGADWARRVACRVIQRIEERTGPVLALATGRAELFLARTGLAGARTEAASCRVATSLARAQAKIARAQGGFARYEAMSAREEAALARVEANRARIEAQLARVEAMPMHWDSGQVRMACPRVRVSIPEISIPQINVPQIRVRQVNVSRVEGLADDDDEGSQD
jgi:hypothetical protein